MSDRTIFIRPNVEIGGVLVEAHARVVNYTNAVRVTQAATDISQVDVRVGFARDANVTLGTETTGAGVGNTTTIVSGDGVGGASDGGNIVLVPGAAAGAGMPGGVAIGEDETEITIAGTAFDARLMVHDELNNILVSVAIEKHSNTAAAGAYFVGARARGTEAASLVVADDDILLGVIAVGFDGADFEQAATIIVEVDDATPSGTSMGAAIVMSTTPATTVTPVERLRIDNAGTVTVAGTLAVNVIQPPTGTTLAINRQDGTMWATTSSGTGSTIFGIPTQFNDQINCIFGSGVDSNIRWSTDQTNDAMLILTTTGTAAQSGNIIISSQVNQALDHAFAASADPQLFVCSTTAPGTNFVSFVHNATDANITVGAGDLEIDAAQVRAPSGSTMVIARGDGTAWVTITNAGTATISVQTRFSNSFGPNDNITMLWGSGNDVLIDWSTAQTNDAMVIATNVGTAAQSGNIIITAAANANLDHAFAAFADAHLFVCSTTTPGTNFVSIHHNATDAMIDVGAGDLEIDATQVRAPAGSSMVLARGDGTAWATITNAGSTTVAVNTRMNDDIRLDFGTSADVRIDYSTAQTNDGLIIGTGVGTAAQSGNIIITALANVDFDHAHAAATNPTFIVHSAAASTTQFIAISHDQTNVRYIAGTGKHFFTGQIGADDGTVSNPGYQFNSDANTGMFRPAGEQVALAGRGFAVLTVDGNVIGATATTLAQPVNTSGSPTALLVTGAAHTTLTLSTEAISVNIDLSATVQFATGALATQRAMVVQAPTYRFVAASVITTAATFAITGAPQEGTNATFTDALAFWVQADEVRFDGTLRVGGLATEKLTVSTTEVVVNDAGAATVSLRVEGASLSHMIFTDPTAATENIAFVTTAVPAWQDMDRGVFIGDVSTAPTGNPTAGLFVWSEAGAGKARGAAGTVTTWAPAEPHCPTCDRDFALEWENDGKTSGVPKGRLAICVWCLMATLESHQVDVAPALIHRSVL